MSRRSRPALRYVDPLSPRGPVYRVYVRLASQAGGPDNPSWFYNLRANPEVLLGGRPFRAQIVQEEAQRARLWELADRVFPAFAAYRDSAAVAGRTIPIVQLLPER